jgi:hypothetical protein
MAVKISNKSFYLLGKAIQYHRKKARLSRNEFADISGVGKTVKIMKKISNKLFLK